MLLFLWWEMVLWRTSEWKHLVILLSFMVGLYRFLLIRCNNSLKLFEKFVTQLRLVYLNEWLSSGYKIKSSEEVFFKNLGKITKHKTQHFNHFKMYNFEAFSTFKMLCSYYHFLIPEHFHHPKKKPCSHKHSFHISLSCIP